MADWDYHRGMGILFARGPAHVRRAARSCDGSCLRGGPTELVAGMRLPHHDLAQGIHRRGNRRLVVLELGLWECCRRWQGGDPLTSEAPHSPSPRIPDTGIGLGLTAAEARLRLERHGPNVLPDARSEDH